MNGPRHPVVEWAHTKTHVTLKVLLQEGKDIQVVSEDKKINFTAKSFDGSIDYAFALDLYAEISPDDTAHKRYTKYITIELAKKEVGDWERLVESTARNQRIKVDWEKWVDFELEEEEKKASEEAAAAKARKMPSMANMQANADVEAKMAEVQAKARAKTLAAADETTPLLKEKTNKKKRGPPTGLKKVYLLGYNALLFFGWTIVVFQLLLGVFSPHTYASLGLVVMMLEAIALLEIANAVLKLVPGNPIPSVILHGGRDAILLAVSMSAGAQTSKALWLLFFAWGVGEVVRYPTYLFTVLDVPCPSGLLWMRYSINLVLLPIGFASEIFLVWNGVADMPMPYDTVFLYCLPLYIPAIPYLLTTMWAQRQSKLFPKAKLN